MESLSQALPHVYAGRLKEADAPPTEEPLFLPAAGRVSPITGVTMGPSLVPVPTAHFDGGVDDEALRGALRETKSCERHVVPNSGRLAPYQSGPAVRESDETYVLLLRALRQLCDALVLEPQHLRDRVQRQRDA